MNELQKPLYSAPSIETVRCPFCGRPATNRHHIVPRSQGGRDGATVTVCGMGNASGCHGKFHHYRLHLRRRNDEWEWLETEEPTNYMDALSLPGWRVLMIHEYEGWL